MSQILKSLKKGLQMAYISKELKDEKTLLLRALGKKYGIILSVARNNRSTIVLNIAAGSIDFFSDYIGIQTYFVDGSPYFSVNQYYLSEQFKSDSLSSEFLEQAITILNAGNWNNSNAMIDYFDIGFYIDINIGKFKKPYIFKGVTK